MKSTIKQYSLLSFCMTVFLSGCSGVHFSAEATSLSSLSNNLISPLVCSAGSDSGTSQQIYPTSCLITQGLDRQTMGLELNDGFQISEKKFILQADDQEAGTSQDNVLYIEIATYVAADSIIISADDGSGNLVQILNICNLATYNLGDPTAGLSRPYSDTILQFSVVLPKGSKNIVFDYSGSSTPTYVGMWNLGEFSDALHTTSTNPFLGTSFSKQFRVQTTSLTAYNDDKDPAQPAQLCAN